ncbi:cytoskeleton protein RodZ [Arsukibacterium tuosuense]|uniref:Cytoskeleton protein RodZ n=1 Tax=Arsukibacterium tuosuense TaxID=1323745 RepID=A0A285JCD9_9GAMM|nr:RodZ domain-containing protein [Arsukibacterium tuosuense]SNY57939.1 cytoskeleton protein RodZ [Arsukibacterium tuosuense]
MTTTEPTELSESTEPTVLTAGQLLSQARERRKLSVAEVALQLNLRVNLVQQIEADQLDSSMLVTFVRGYLRAYARLVKLPEKQVLTAFEQQNVGSGDPAKPMRTFSNRAELQATENRFMWLTYAIGFILILMLVLWWWQTTSPGADGAPGQQPAAAAQVDNGSAAPAMAGSTVNAGEAESTIETKSADSSNAETEPAAVSLPDFIAAETMPELASQIAAEAVASPQPDVIIMDFQDNCWIDVLDADGNRIAYGTKEAGYQMMVSGKAPFVVTLGNPSVVRITLNNQPFDMSSLPAGRVAKFTLAEPD